MDRRRPQEDDLSPIRQSLPEGPAAPVAPVLIQWVLLAAAGFSLRISPDLTAVHGAIQMAGIVAAVIAFGISLRMVATRSVTGRYSGWAGILIALAEVAYLVWLIRQRSSYGM